MLSLVEERCLRQFPLLRKLASASCPFPRCSSRTQYTPGFGLSGGFEYNLSCQLSYAGPSELLCEDSRSGVEWGAVLISLMDTWRCVSQGGLRAFGWACVVSVSPLAGPLSRPQLP
jgi:hypothetical protein